ncbi:hypothetical protein FBQ62_15280 [Salmonella enterica]|nr:hypothetical protein [Salmonella enterica subsp. arizonae serovar 63:z36:-]
MRLDFILRPAVELYSASAALLAAIWCVTAPQTLLRTPCSGWLLAPALLALFALRLKQGLRILRFRRRVRHLPLWTLSASLIPLLPDALFLGCGFRWLPTHTQRLYLYRLPQCEHWLHTDRPSASGGDPLLHGVELREGHVTLPLRDRPGHTLVLGTTRVGKTRLAELLIAQDIRRGDTVIVFDPKGDADLLRRVWAEAHRAGRESVFWLFHLGWPEISARYNAVGRFGRISEVASRIAGQLRRLPRVRVALRQHHHPRPGGARPAPGLCPHSPPCDKYRRTVYRLRPRLPARPRPSGMGQRGADCRWHHREKHAA